MGDDETDFGGFELRPLWRGLKLFRDYAETALLWGRWRLIWFNPRWRDNWRVEWIYQDDCIQLGLGPLAVVYIRSED